MKLQQINRPLFNGSKLMHPVRGHIIGRVERASGLKINSVFLRNRNFGSKINWQTELLKLEDAS
jgi:hypothetical protein